MQTAELPKQRVVGSTLVAVRHSAFSEPTFILQGIGPAQFRSHFLFLDNGTVLDLFTAEITIASPPENTMPGETIGRPITELLGRRIVALARDDVRSSLVILEGELFLRDANDGCYGNPLLAGKLHEEYRADQIGQFLDYWTEMSWRPAEQGDPPDCGGIT
jgi:hypothetical protein